MYQLKTFNQFDWVNSVYPIFDMMHIRVISTLALFLISLHTTHAVRVLALFPIPWRSHQFVFKSLVRGLGEAGHHVDFYTPLPMKEPPKTVRQIQVHDTLHEGLASSNLDEYINSGPWGNAQTVYDVVLFMVKRAITTGTWFRELLDSNSTYDVVLSEFPLHSEPLAYLAHRFNASNVAVVPMLDNPWVNEIAGLPDNPSYMLSYQAETDDKMDFSQRFRNMVRTVCTNLCSYWIVATKGQALADEYIRYEGWENRPRLLEMVSDVALILQNSHPSMAYPYPKAPQVKEVGGMHIAPNKPLPQDIQKFMDEASDGVIYFSLGSNLNPEDLMGNGIFEAFVNVFKRLKQRVIWKISPGLASVTDPNVKTLTWCPQQDILAHKNTVLFITHGGLQSMVETINFGVPVVAMPVVFDQIKNVEFIRSIEIGVKLTFDNVTESSLSWSISEVLSNPKYREQAKKRQAMFRDRPMSPVKEAVYWIEYVARHGNVLQPASARMPFYQLYLIDIGVFIVVSSVLFWKLFIASLAMVWKNKGTSEPRKYVNAKKKKA